MEPRYRVTNHNLILECNARGLPSTTTLWSRDGIRITPTDSQTLVMDSTLVEFQDNRLAQYRNTLAMTEGVFGVMSCDVYGDWVTADKRDSGRSSRFAITIA